MKILLINTVPFAINGISVVVLNEYEKLSNKGINVDIVANSTIDAGYKIRIESKNGKLFILSDRKNHIHHYIKELSKLLRHNHYDIIHIHGNSSTMLFEILANKLAKSTAKVLVHNHNTNVSSTPINKVLYPFFIKMYDKAIACGNKAGKALYKNKEFDIINNGIDLQMYRFSSEKREKIRGSLSLDEQTQVIGHIGSFNQQKNHKFLVDIFDLLQKEFSNSVLLLIGDGDKKNEIFNIISSLGIEEKVIYIKKTNNISEYLHAMDIFVLPSLHEGLPLVGIEAQASGLPCIISDEVDKTVNHSKNMFFLSINNGIGAWKNKIVNIISNEVDREALSKTNINKLKSAKFGIDESTEKLINIYYDVLKGDRKEK